MNPVELHLPDGKPSGVWMCQCGRIYADGMYSISGLSRGAAVGAGREAAERCCQPHVCRYCTLPVVDESGYREHQVCRNAEYRKRAAERLAKAEKLESYDGWLYLDGANKYFQDMGAVLDYLECDDEDDPQDWPEFAYCCKEVPFEGPSPGDIYESLTEELYDEASEDLQGCAEFEAACKVFTEANQHLLSYEPDYNHAVRIPRREKA